MSTTIIKKTNSLWQQQQHLLDIPQRVVGCCYCLSCLSFNTARAFTNTRALYSFYHSLTPSLTRDLAHCHTLTHNKLYQTCAGFLNCDL